MGCAAAVNAVIDAIVGRGLACSKDREVCECGPTVRRWWIGLQ